jgi:DNA-binding NtrC family response regulator
MVAACDSFPFAPKWMVLLHEEKPLPTKGIAAAAVESCLAQSSLLIGGVADQEQGGEALLTPASRPDRPLLVRYGVTRLLDERGEMRPIGALEEEVIRFAIAHYRGRMSEVARRLGIGRSTLYRKIKDYGIASREFVLS